MKNLTADLSLKSQFFYKHEDKDDMDRFLGPQLAKVKHGHIYPSFVFRLNEDDDQNKKHFGLIAQELETIYPELVVNSEIGFKAVNYTELIPIMLAQMKNMQTEIDKLKEEIKGLR